MIENILMLGLMLLGAHWLQGDSLSKAKQTGPLRVYHLVAHSGIQGAGVALITGNVWLGLAEWLFHTVIDEAKVKGRITFAQDQGLHIGCKALWLGLILKSAWLSTGPSTSWWR